MKDMIGKRVQLHPACDEWMQGDRYGEVISIVNTRMGAKLLRVKLDSGRVRKFHPSNILEVINV